MARRKRQQQQPQGAAGEGGTAGGLLVGLNLGYNGYTDPTVLSPRAWAAASNVYSGQHGEIRRARFAPVVNSLTVGYGINQAVFDSLYNFRDTTPQTMLLGDINGKMYAFNIAFSYAASLRVNPYFDPSGNGATIMRGPWSRAAMFNLVFETNGKVKQTGRETGATTIENWGIDTPDASPSVVTAAGSISKVIGRSYAYAWENTNKANVSAPSPGSTYIPYDGQSGVISLIQPGTVGVVIASNVVTGVGTFFSQAWVGKNIWIEDYDSSGNFRIVSVEDSHHLTIADIGDGVTLTARRYQIFDRQATHVRLYATADGGATYFRIARNGIALTGATGTGTLAVCGLQFTDTDPSEPPSGTFTVEQAQFFNVPPPIGRFVEEYQSRLVIFGVDAASQSIFYSNIESTNIGNPPECFAPLNQITFPMKDANVAGMAGLPTGLIVWSDRQDMFKITGLLSDNSIATSVQLGAAIQRLPYNLGLAGAFAVVVTQLGAIWLSSNKEVWLFTDSYAPRNIGRSIQNVLSAINPDRIADARMANLRADDRNWVVLSVATGNSTVNNTVLILDVDMLSAGGTPSFFVFDMATNQPSWYIFNQVAEAVTPVFDNFGNQHLMAGDFDRITDLTYKTGYFVQGEEDLVPGFVLLHAVGNEDPYTLKKLRFVRFITNRDPADLQDDGWQFRIDTADDDLYTLDAPQTLLLYPGVDSPTLGHAAAAVSQLGVVQDRYPNLIKQLAGTFGQNFFVTRGAKLVQGRRIRFMVNFPPTPGLDYALRSIQAPLEE